MSTYGEFAYQPKFMTCDLTCYSDACNKHTNGLLVCRVHFDRSVKKCVSSSDLSTYYVHDLVRLLNTSEKGFKEMAKAHKTMTEDVNFIQYDELKDLYECVDDLAKMTRRLQIVGTSAFSILRDDRKLNTGVCIQGHVSQPDNLFVPMANFFDEKIVPIETIAEYLTTGSRQTVIPMDIKNHRYALTGSIIYLIIYRRNGIFDYIVYISEEPISNLIQSVKDTTSNFDFIYTTVARTITEEESAPYTVLAGGICFKDVVLYCNENQLSSPILKTYRQFENIFKGKTSEFFIDSSLHLFSSTLNPGIERSPEVKLVELLLKYKNNPIHLWNRLSSLNVDANINALCSNPIKEALLRAELYIREHFSKFDISKLVAFLERWLDLTNTEDIQNLIAYVKKQNHHSHYSKHSYDNYGEHDDFDFNFD
jgi:hypothetical protein